MTEDLQTGDYTEAAVQTDTDDAMTQEQQQENQTVPLSALQQERQQRQKLQEDLQLLKDHMSLLQSNQAAQSKKKDDFEDLTDNDVLTVGEAKKFIQNFSKEQQLAVEELKISQQYPDYSEVVRNYLPEVLKNDPDLKDVITNAPNPYKAAYYLAKRSDGYLKNKRQSSRSKEAKEAVENLQRPGTLSSVGTGVSGTASKGYKTMNDADFRKLMNKNLGYS